MACAKLSVLRTITLKCSDFRFVRHAHLLWSRARLRVAHTCALRKPVFQQTGATAPKEAGNSPEEYARIHGEFMTMVHDLIDGSLESSAYEDHCRALLGECL